MRIRTLAILAITAAAAVAGWLHYGQGKWPPALTALLGSGTEKTKGQGGGAGASDGAGGAPMRPPEVTASQPVRQPVI